MSDLAVLFFKFEPEYFEEEIQRWRSKLVHPQGFYSLASQELGLRLWVGDERATEYAKQSLVDSTQFTNVLFHMAKRMGSTFPESLFDQAEQLAIRFPDELNYRQFFQLHPPQTEKGKWLIFNKYARSNSLHSDIRIATDYLAPMGATAVSALVKIGTEEKFSRWYINQNWGKIKGVSRRMKTDGQKLTPEQARNLIQHAVNTLKNMNALGDTLFYKTTIDAITASFGVIPKDTLRFEYNKMKFRINPLDLLRCGGEKSYYERLSKKPNIAFFISLRNALSR